MPDPPPKPLINPTFLFRFEVPLRRNACKWTAKGLKLPEECQVRSFAELSGARPFADLRMAWNPDGIGLQLSVKNKRKSLWCRDTRPEASDGLKLFIDTRCSPNIHRATQFCHQFMWMPTGAGSRRDQPFADLIPIERAGGHPKPIGGNVLKIAATPRHDGYEMSGFIPATALTGFDPTDQPRIGLFYVVADQEFGWQMMALDGDYPFAVDPSMWGEAVLEP